MLIIIIAELQNVPFQFRFPYEKRADFNARENFHVRIIPMNELVQCATKNFFPY